MRQNKINLYNLLKMRSKPYSKITIQFDASYTAAN